ncbi:MAG TPA: S53 family peptidase [Kofleriaceae bacterium]
MRFSLTISLTRALFPLAIGTLALASCATAPEPTEDQQTADDSGTQAPTMSVCNGSRWQCKSHVRVDEHNRIRPFATPAGLGPADLASAYKLDAARTSTNLIAIVDAFNYPNAESDLASYRSQFGLPACTKANGCLRVVNQNGATSPLPANSPAGDDWTVEAALDLDMASAACPTCKLILIEANDDTSNGLFVAQNTAASLGAFVVSDSWGGPSDGTDATLDSQFFTHTQAITTFVASGDSGNTGASPDYPSTSLKVVGVGGTHLVRSTAARGWTETVWSGAGSSCSKLLAKPAFQSSVVPTAACGKRAASDISAVADPNTGLAVFNAGAGGFIVVGGTSAASPFVAGVWARYGISGASHDASYPYAHPCELFDVTSGSNGSCTSALCKATTGWDGPTGLGTPNGATFGKSTTCATPPPPTCSHLLCNTGAALVSGCNSCATSICAADSFCCASSWDSICVGEVSSVCGLSCPGI